jgi:hypothetical protein
MQTPTDHRPAAVPDVHSGTWPADGVAVRPTDRRPADRPVWRVGDIDFSRADRRHRGNTTLFYVLTGASFVESGSDLYTRNLLTYYRGDPSIADWLSHAWEPEELQHGAALRAYVEAVWPEFDWDRAYRGFMAEYSRAASPEAFEATPHLELAARCMIETGTASLYRMLYDYVQEPVLRQVLGHIRDDEINHYKHFLHFFRTGRQRELGGALKVAWAIGRRVRESRRDDAWIAFRHAFEVSHPGRRCQRSDFDQWQAQLQAILRSAFPFRMAAEMLVAPLALSPLARRLARRATEAGLRHLLFA